MLKLFLTLRPLFAFGKDNNGAHMLEATEVRVDESGNAFLKFNILGEVKGKDGKTIDGAYQTISLGNGTTFVGPENDKIAFQRWKTKQRSAGIQKGEAMGKDEWYAKGKQEGKKEVGKMLRSWKKAQVGSTQAAILQKKVTDRTRPQNKSSTQDDSGERGDYGDFSLLRGAWDPASATGWRGTLAIAGVIGFLGKKLWNYAFVGDDKEQKRLIERAANNAGISPIDLTHEDVQDLMAKDVADAARELNTFVREEKRINIGNETRTDAQDARNEENSLAIEGKDRVEEINFAATREKVLKQKLVMARCIADAFQQSYDFYSGVATGSPVPRRGRLAVDAELLNLTKKEKSRLKRRQAAAMRLGKQMGRLSRNSFWSGYYTFLGRGAGSLLGNICKWLLGFLLIFVLLRAIMQFSSELSQFKQNGGGSFANWLGLDDIGGALNFLDGSFTGE